MSAATVNISETNGAGPTGVTTDGISNINFGSVDTPNLVAASHPVIIGERAYQKFLRFHVASLGTSTTIKDLRYWASFYVPVTGEVLRDDNFVKKGSAINYATPTQDGLPEGGTIGTSDPGSPNVDIAGDLAGTIIAPGYSGYFLMQIVSTVSTPVGPANTKTLTFQYDET